MDREQRLDLADRQGKPTGERLAILETEMLNVKDDYKDLKTDLKGVKTALWSLAAAIVFGAITFAYAALQLTG